MVILIVCTTGTSGSVVCIISTLRIGLCAPPSCEEMRQRLWFRTVGLGQGSEHLWPKSQQRSRVNQSFGRSTPGVLSFIQALPVLSCPTVDVDAVSYQLLIADGGRVSVTAWKPRL